MPKFLLALTLALLVACNADDSNNDRSPTDTDQPDATQPDTDQPDATQPDPDAGLPDTDVDADETVELPPQPWSIYQPGHYRVGYRSGFEFTYDAVGEPGRKIPFVVWYPTLDEGGPKPKYYNIFLRAGVQNNASLALTEPAPVLIFSHGNGAFAEQSYYLTEFFASHGWIVVAPHHTGNTFKDTQGAIDLRSGGFRPQDISALLDHLENLPNDEPLKAALSDNIAMAGHSFGGYTTLATAGSGFDIDYAESYCAMTPSQFCDLLEVDGFSDMFRMGVGDPRVKVAIPQTPGGYLVFQNGLAQITTPTLVMTALLDATLPADEEGDPIWAAMQGDHMRVDLVRGGHFTYSNMCELFSSLVPDDGCSDRFVPYTTGFEIINAYTMAFARKHLFDDATNDDLLDGTHQPWAAEVDLDWK